MTPAATPAQAGTEARALRRPWTGAVKTEDYGVARDVDLDTVCPFLETVAIMVELLPSQGELVWRSMSPHGGARHYWPATGPAVKWGNQRGLNHACAPGSLRKQLMLGAASWVWRACRDCGTEIARVRSRRSRSMPVGRSTDSNVDCCIGWFR